MGFSEEIGVSTDELKYVMNIVEAKVRPQLQAIHKQQKGTDAAVKATTLESRLNSLTIKLNTELDKRGESKLPKAEIRNLTYQAPATPEITITK